MAIEIKAVRGTQDVLPEQSYKWRFMEGVLAKAASLYGYKEIRIPTFEQTELYSRSSGETSDIVSKEMYTFRDNGDRSITLRPEGTAGVVRAVLENGLLNHPLPLKVWYALSAFRYGRPQAGRLREFHQFGLEIFGAASYAADAEVITFLSRFFESMGLSSIDLEINSIGCKACRPGYHKALKDYFQTNSHRLCPTCLERLDKNPMRILDCKSEECQRVGAEAPKTIDYLCGDCQEHLGGVRSCLEALQIPYILNPSVVRGLDYYNRTVFEFLSDALGPRLAIAAGGRYDGLVEELGGPSIPGLGFGMGLERMLLLLEKTGYCFPDEQLADIYIVPMGNRAVLQASLIAEQVRKAGLCCITELTGRSLKAAMKYANNTGAAFSLILGDQELDSGNWILRSMGKSEQTEVRSADELIRIVKTLKGNE